MPEFEFHRIGNINLDSFVMSLGYVAGWILLRFVLFTRIELSIFDMLSKNKVENIEYHPNRWDSDYPWITGSALGLLALYDSSMLEEILNPLTTSFSINVAQIVGVTFFLSLFLSLAGQARHDIFLFGWKGAILFPMRIVKLFLSLVTGIATSPLSIIATMFLYGNPLKILLHIFNIPVWMIGKIFNPQLRIPWRLST